MWIRGRHAGVADTELVALVAKGSESAFKELLNRHQEAVYQLVHRFLGDANETEDITQETFLRLYRTAARYQPKASLRTFLFRIAKNLCIDFVRKKRPEPAEQLPEAIDPKTPQDLLECAQAIEMLSNCIDTLPENQRMAILLRHTSGLRYQEIADVMGLTVSAVESLLVRARKTLRQRLDPKRLLGFK
jgi:RNA polymerase sigma-70 factor (ECF subfamily)